MPLETKRWKPQKRRWCEIAATAYGGLELSEHKDPVDAETQLSYTYVAILAVAGSIKEISRREIVNIVGLKTVLWGTPRRTVPRGLSSSCDSV